MWSKRWSKFWHKSRIEKLARIGLVAQGISFALVAVLAIELALGEGGKATDRQGALRALAEHSEGRVVVIALAVGFGCYALWRLFEAIFGHKLESYRDEGIWKRASAAGKAAIYGGLCAVAVSILLGEEGGGNEEQEATEGILGWPGGRWIVYAIALALAAAAVWNVWRGVSRRFEKQLKTGEMDARARRVTTVFAVTGLVARGIVFGLISWFFFKAAAEYDPDEARGLDGALRKLAAQEYGQGLLGLVAAGLLAYGGFCLVQARYREV